MIWRVLVVLLLFTAAWPRTLRAQLQDSAATDAIRVTLTVNQDGSRTAYEVDPPNHKAVATTTSADGKPQGKTRYVLDDAGRFATGEVFGPSGQFRFKSRYTYDNAGLLREETQLSKEDAVQHKIVYSYNEAGKQTGYAVYDGKGTLLGQTTPISHGPTPAKKAK